MSGNSTLTIRVTCPRGGGPWSGGPWGGGPWGGGPWGDGPWGGGPWGGGPWGGGPFSGPWRWRRMVFCSRSCKIYIQYLG